MGISFVWEICSAVSRNLQRHNPLLTHYCVKSGCSSLKLDIEAAGSTYFTREKIINLITRHSADWVQQQVIELCNIYLYFSKKSYRQLQNVLSLYIGLVLWSLYDACYVISEISLLNLSHCLVFPLTLLNLISDITALCTILIFVLVQSEWINV
jgi:hypothetical protein